MDNDKLIEHRQQRLDEWTALDDDSLKYHMSQWEAPKQSSIAFESFFSLQLMGSSSVIDMGSGAGAATAYLSKRYSTVNFTAFDYSADLVRIGNTIAREKEIRNLTFRHGDWFNLSATTEFDGVISLQTLSWLPEFENPLLEIFNKIQPKWIGLTSLFYEGDITCRIEVEEHRRGRKSFYNIYSLPAVSRFCDAKGYRLEKCVPFKIDIDIAEPTEKDLMGTYTKRVMTENEAGFERLQISGPILMNWYMLLIEKS